MINSEGKKGCASSICLDYYVVVDFFWQLCGVVGGLLPLSEYLISTVCQFVLLLIDL